ncbi:hypothetical protein GCM10027614_35860 [Micromonospora vulcania]
MPGCTWAGTPGGIRVDLAGYSTATGASSQTGPASALDARPARTARNARREQRGEQHEGGQRDAGQQIGRSLRKQDELGERGHPRGPENPQRYRHGLNLDPGVKPSDTFPEVNTLGNQGPTDADRPRPAGTDGGVDDRPGDGAARRYDRGTELLTVGVEEEFLLVDPHTGAAVPAVDLVLEQVPAELRGQVEREFQTSQIEIGTPPGLELSSIRHSLGVLRRALADAAEQAGVRLLAIGTGPVDGPVPPVVDKPRFDQMIERFRLLVPGPGNNGMHVHVGIPDPETGVQVLNHVRPWLPMLHAVTTNSPSPGARTPGTPVGGRWSGSAGPRWPRRPSWSRTSTTSD